MNRIVLCSTVLLACSNDAPSMQEYVEGLIAQCDESRIAFTRASMCMHRGAYFCIPIDRVGDDPTPWIDDYGITARIGCQDMAPSGPVDCDFASERVCVIPDASGLASCDPSDDETWAELCFASTLEGASTVRHITAP